MPLPYFHRFCARWNRFTTNCAGSPGLQSESAVMVWNFIEIPCGKPNVLVTRCEKKRLELLIVKPAPGKVEKNAARRIWPSPGRIADRYFQSACRFRLSPLAPRSRGPAHSDSVLGYFLRSEASCSQRRPRRIEFPVWLSNGRPRCFLALARDGRLLDGRAASRLGYVKLGSEKRFILRTSNASKKRTL